MQLRWTAGAAADLENIADYLLEKAPRHAPRLLRTIYNRIAALKNFPNRGRPGKKDGTRELMIPSLPYMVIYQIEHDCVHVVRILHSAQRWPV